MVALSGKIGFIKVILLRQRWKPGDMPKAVDFIRSHMFTGLNPGDSVGYFGGGGGNQILNTDMIC